MRIDLLVVRDCPSDCAVAGLIAQAVGELGVEVTLIRTVVTEPAQAQGLDFAGSPTILVDGVDLFERSELPVGLACRLYPTADGPRGVPTLEDLRRSLSREVARRRGA